MKTTPLEILYVKELTGLLGLRDPRSAKRWCLLNNVSIIKNQGSRVSYVIRSDYEVARNRAFIKLLKNRHGKDWFAVYQAHVDFNIALLSGLQSAGKENSIDRKNCALPVNTGMHEQRFLNVINSLD